MLKRDCTGLTKSLMKNKSVDQTEARSSAPYIQSLYDSTSKYSHIGDLALEEMLVEEIYLPQVQMWWV